jgi:hypothetical protein
MLRLALGAALSLSVMTAAFASSPISPPAAGSDITRVAEGCGEGFWRGPNGHCHPYAHGRACPRGYHLGNERHRCWPN